MDRSEGERILREAQGNRLEQEAIVFIKKYGLFLPAPAKEFFRKLADYLDWTTLKEQLK